MDEFPAPHSKAPLEIHFFPTQDLEGDQKGAKHEMWSVGPVWHTLRTKTPGGLTKRGTATQKTHPGRDVLTQKRGPGKGGSRVLQIFPPSANRTLGGVGSGQE